MWFLINILKRWSFIRKTLISLFSDSSWPLILLSTIGKAGVTLAYAVVYPFTAELFPTMLRNTALSFASACSRLGSLIAPQLAMMVGEMLLTHDDVSNGNIYRVTGHLCGEFTGPGEFPAQRPVTRTFDVFFDLRLNKRLSKQSWGWWFETLSRPLWRHCNEWRQNEH